MIYHALTLYLGDILVLMIGGLAFAYSVYLVIREEQ